MKGVVQFRLVDAFAEQAYTGNPAGVVLNAEGLSDAQMQLISREIRASETAFLAPGSDRQAPTRLRWFTPQAEVQFCGHATLAAAHASTEGAALGRLVENAGARVVFDTAAGPLRLRAEALPGAPGAAMWWLEMPDPGLKPDHTHSARTCALLGLTADDLDPEVPITRTRDDDLILIVRGWQCLFGMQPNFPELVRWSQRHGIRGYCVATLNTLSPMATVQSRFFAPAVGVPEDPVTGSVHGPLAAMLVSRELVPHESGRSSLYCLQGEPGGRNGVVRALVESTPPGYRVQVGGRCQVTLRGELCVPPA